MMIECRYDHIHLMVGDPEGAAAWFCDHLGGQIVGRVASLDRPRIDVDLGGVRLFLSPYPGEGASSSERKRGIDHIAFAVADVDRAAEVLSGRGVVILEPPSSSRPGTRTVFLQGPDNIRIELLKRG